MATRDATDSVRPSPSRLIARLTGNPDLLRVHAGCFAGGSALLALAELAGGPLAHGATGVVAPWAALLGCHAWWVAMQRGRPASVAIAAVRAEPGPVPAVAQVPLPGPDLPAMSDAGPSDAGPSLAAATAAALAAAAEPVPPLPSAARGTEPQVEALASDLARLREALGRGDLWSTPAAGTAGDDLSESVLALWQRPAPVAVAVSAAPVATPPEPVPTPVGKPQPARAKPDPLRLSWV